MGGIMLITGIVLSLTALLYARLIGLFTFGWYRKKGPNISGTSEGSMRVSVIVAARNEEKCITDLLNDLAAQHYPSFLMEILVVDDHSTDKTVKITTEFIDRQKLPYFNLIKNDEGVGKKASIAHGIGRSSGDLILLTDADCRLGPGWVSAMVSYFEDKTKMMISGPVAYLKKKGLLNRFQSLEFSGLMASGAGAALAGRPFMCNGANLAYRKEAFLQVSGYEGIENFISGDDVFLMHKMKEEFGSKAIGFAMDINALVRTYPASGIRAFLNQRIRWASKTRGYKDTLATMTAITVFLFNFSIVAVFFAGFFLPTLFLLYFNFIILKSIIDLPLIYGITGFNKERRILNWYLLFQLIYPLYIMIAGILSLFRNKKW